MRSDEEGELIKRGPKDEHDLHLRWQVGRGWCWYYATVVPGVCITSGPHGGSVNVPRSRPDLAQARAVKAAQREHRREIKHLEERVCHHRKWLEALEAE